MTSQETYGCACCCYFVLVITSIILFGCSFSTLEVNKVALRYNSISRSYDTTTLYAPGRHFVGLAYSLVTFPTTWGEIKFCSDCDDGGPVTTKALQTDDTGAVGSSVSVHISVTIYYELRWELAPSLIDTYPRKNWKAQYIALLRNAIVEAVPQNSMSIDDLIKNRSGDTGVTRKFAWLMNEKLEPFYASVRRVYLGQIALGEKTEGDSQVDLGFLNRWIAQRQIQTSDIKGDTEKVRAETQALVSAEEAKVTTTLSEMFLTTNSTLAEKTAAGTQTLLQAEGLGYLYLQKKLQFNEKELMRYIYYDKISQEANSIISGFGDAKKSISR